MIRKKFNLLAVFSLFNLFHPWYSSADVTNMSAYPIYLKPEKNCSSPIKVNPGETFKGAHDAIIVPSQKPGKVYKTVDNVDAVVAEDGEIHSSANDIQGAVGQVIIGGWRDAPPPESRGRGKWAIYFEKSREGEKERVKESEIKATGPKTIEEHRREPKGHARLDQSEHIEDKR